MKVSRRKIWGLLFTVFAASTAGAQNTDSSADFRLRKTAVWVGESSLFAGVHTALYMEWYSGYPSSRFHFINDNGQWLQMDKAGHAFSAYFIGVNTSAFMQWAGYNRKKSAMIGAAAAMLFQTPIEIFDGYSQGWGASKGDMVANTAGTLFAGLQTYFWGRVRVPMRVTFHYSEFADVRPNLLGSNLPERMLKDYNGQTYWIDLNPERMKVSPPWWPKWLGINLGYGAEGMLGGDNNVWTDAKGRIQDYAAVPRYRQYYIGPSLSFGYLEKHRSPWLRALGFVSERIRLPLPAVEWSRPFGVKMRWGYW